MSLTYALNGSQRRIVTGIAALVVLLSLLAFEPVRAAADQLLQIFRVRTVVFVPVGPERIEQLQNLKLDQQALFVAPPKQMNEAVPPRSVTTIAEASAAVGFDVAQPQLPEPPTTTKITVSSRSVYQFQVNLESARNLLTLAGVNDVTLPDTLGDGPITAEMAPAVALQYGGPGYDLTLIQARSPEVTLPKGVDMAQLGMATLRLLGVAPDQAETLSKQIDWSSTLIFPFPASPGNFRQVMIGDAQGMLITPGKSGERKVHLYWQRGDRFYVLMGSGSMNNSELSTTMIAVAESIR